MVFKTRITIPFGDTDPAGLVYYPNLFHYVHIGMERFFEACCGKRYADLVTNERLGFPTIKVEAEFVTPVVYGDEVELTVRVLSLGKKSVTIEYAIYKIPGEILCARINQVHVAMDLERRQSQAIPPDLHKSFHSGLKAVEV
jgi:4-hydroxybenzoyl-CoA thioesterase